MKEKQQDSFIVCKYKDYYFIDKILANNQKIDYTDEITVDNKAFVLINKEDIEEIENNLNFVRNEIEIKPTNDADISFNNDKEETINKTK